MTCRSTYKKNLSTLTNSLLFFIGSRVKNENEVEDLSLKSVVQHS
jgi:hypothetical protein